MPACCYEDLKSISDDLWTFFSVSAVRKNKKKKNEQEKEAGKGSS